MAWPTPGGFNSGVRQEPGHLPDWRDAEAYAPLLEVERAGFAWEWLRRDPAYREAALAAAPNPSTAAGIGAQVDEAAARWGLHAFEAPGRDARSARPVWRREHFPFVLEAEALDEGGIDERLDLARLEPFATLLKSGCGSEHLLLSDGCRALRLDIVRGSLVAGPVKLRYRLAGMLASQAPLLALRQLLALWRTRRFSPALHPPEQRAHRWTFALRAHDALDAGAGQREIAAELIGTDAMAARWRVEASSLRSRAQRLVREARRMAAGGYVSLLQPRRPIL